MKEDKIGKIALVAARHFVDEGYALEDIESKRIRQSYVVTIVDYDGYDDTYLVEFQSKEQDVFDDGIDTLWIYSRHVRVLPPSIITVEQDDVDTDSRLSDEDKAVIKEYINGQV